MCTSTIEYRILIAVQHGLSARNRLAIHVARHMANQVVREKYEFYYVCSSYVRGYHKYKEGWTPSLGEMLEPKVEPTNAHDQFATVVIKPDGTVVGHIPKHAGKAVLFFLRKAASARFCEVTGSNVNHGVGLGLEIPRNYKFCGRQAYIDRLQTLLL